MVESTHHLGIGEIFVSSNPTIVDTILGSCVSVCIYSREEKIGGIIHYALPEKRLADGTKRSDLHFGDLAISILYSEVQRLLQNPSSKLEAKITGGASVITQIAHSANIGDLNIAIAREKLRELGLPITGEDVGGLVGRKLYFYTDTGRLRVAKLSSGVAPI